MSSRALHLFDEIVRGGSARIEQFVEQQTRESEYLDFKSGKATGEKVGEIWSEALAGFANNEGGVLVWGIEARRIPVVGMEAKIDCASGLSPLSDVQSRQQTLRDLLLHAVDPYLAGVEVEAIVTQENQGYVVCFVPGGSERPYAASLAKKTRFPIRIGDNMVELSRTMLRAMFFPQQSARYRLHARGGITQLGSRQSLSVSLIVENVGSATARELWLVVRRSMEMTFKDTASFRVRRLSSCCEGWEAFQSIHPGANICTSMYRADSVERTDTLQLEVFLYALHQIPHRAELTIRLDAFDVDFEVTEYSVPVERETSLLASARDSSL